MRFFLSCTAVVFLAFFACSGSKRQAKRAAVLEASGMSEEAANYYWDALRRNPKNLDAQIGLKKTGQVVLDKMIEEFMLYNQDNDAKKSYQLSQKALKYQSDAARFQVALQIASQVTNDFTQTKNRYLAQLYDRGKSALEAEKFADAERTLSELLSIERDYRDSRELYDIARLEPLYRTAKEHMAGGKNRLAYYKFEEILRQLNYKDSKVLQEQARKLGTTTIAVFPYQNATRARDAEMRLYAYCLSELLAVKNPFLEVMDRQNLDVLMQEQKLGVSGIVDDNSAAQAGKLLGIKVVLFGTLLEYSETPSRLQSVQKQGYEAFWVQKYDTATKQNIKVRQFKPVFYNEFSQSVEIAVSFQYKLIATETGRVLFTSILGDKKADRIEYATYNGVTDNLFPGSQTAVSTDAQSKRNLDNLLRARKTLKSNSDLTQDIFTSLAKQMAKQVTEIFQQD